MSGLFSLYVPGDSPLHRLGVGWKYLVVLVLTLPALIVQQPWATTVALVITVLGLLSTGLPARATLALPWGLIGLLAVLALFQVLVGQPTLALVVPGNVLLAVLASRLLITTTRAAVLIDALVAAADRIPFDPACTDGAMSEMARAAFWRGTCIVAAHQARVASGKPGYVDATGAGSAIPSNRSTP